MKNREIFTKYREIANGTRLLLPPFLPKGGEQKDPPYEPRNLGAPLNTLQ